MHHSTFLRFGALAINSMTAFNKIHPARSEVIFALLRAYFLTKTQENRKNSAMVSRLPLFYTKV